MFLGNPGHMDIDGVIIDDSGTMLRAYSKQTGEELAIKAEILALLEV